VKLEVGQTKKATIIVDDDDTAKFILSKEWYVYFQTEYQAYRIFEWRKETRSLGKGLAVQLFARKTGIFLRRVKYKNGDCLDLRFENLLGNSKKWTNENVAATEAIVPLTREKDTVQQKYQACVKVGGVTRYVGKPSASIKKVMAEHDRYVLEKDLDISLLLPPEPKPVRKWEYEPIEESVSQTTPA